MINVEALKNKVLDLAMHGKLVAQDPQDEPVSALIEKIKEEKSQLIKDKKIKKAKALPPIKENEIPYEIPDSWEWVRLGDIVRFENGDRGKNYPGKKYWIDSGIPFLNSGSLDGMGGIDSKKINYISKERFSLLKSGFIKKNDILYTLRGSVGKVGINNINQGAIASSLVIIRPINMNPMYLLDVLMSTLNFIFLDKFKNGSAQPNLSVKLLMKFMVPLPPQQEQQRIVDKIEEIFSELDKLGEASQKYDECKKLLNKRVLDLAMHGKLVAQDRQDEPASVLIEKIKEEKAQLIKDKKIKKNKVLPPIEEDEIPYKIPDNWEWVRLGDIVRFENGDRGKNYPGKKYWIDSGIPFLNSGSLDGMGGIDSKKINYISKERFSLLKSGFIKKNDILYTLRGSVGKVGINNINQGAIASSLVIIRPINMNPMYLLDVLMSTLNFIFLDKFKNGSAQPNLSVKLLMKFMVPLPPQQEQQRIVDKVKKIMIC